MATEVGDGNKRKIVRERTEKRKINKNEDEDESEEEEDEEYDEDEEYLPPTDDESVQYVEQVWVRPVSRLRRVNDPEVDLSSIESDGDEEPN